MTDALLALSAACFMFAVWVAWRGAAPAKSTERPQRGPLAGSEDCNAKLTDEIGGGSAGLVEPSTGLRLRPEQTGGTVAE